MSRRDISGFRRVDRAGQEVVGVDEFGAVECDGGLRIGLGWWWR